MSDSIRERLEAEHDARHESKAIIWGRLIVTTCHQSSGAPIIDKATGKTREDIDWRGYALHLSPWRKNQYGDRLGGKAFCIGLLKDLVTK